jgi:hypothetical protein
MCDCALLCCDKRPLIRVTSARNCASFNQCLFFIMSHCQLTDMRFRDGLLAELDCERQRGTKWPAVMHSRSPTAVFYWTLLHYDECSSSDTDHFTCKC